MEEFKGFDEDDCLGDELYDVGYTPEEVEEFKGFDDIEEIDKICGIECNHDITLSEDNARMNNNIIIHANGNTSMYLYTALDSIEIKKYYDKDFNFLCEKRFYESPEEAKMQLDIDGDMKCLGLLVSTTNTVFDTLHTADINAFESFYSVAGLKIKESFDKQKKHDNGIKDLEIYVLKYAKRMKGYENKCLVRCLDRAKSNKHDLKCVSQRNILSYILIDTKIIENHGLRAF